MPEEAPRRGVDAIAAAAEIDLVQIKLEDLVLREFPFERHRQDHLAQLARPGVAVREKDVARQLLGDRRGTLEAAAGAAVLHRDDRGARHADGVDAGVIAETPVLDRDHRVLHHLRRFPERQPAPVIGAERQEHRAVGGVDADRLPRGRFLQLLETRDTLHRDADRDRERDRADEREAEAPAKQPPQPDAPARRLAPAGRFPAGRTAFSGAVRGCSCLLSLAAQSRFLPRCAPVRVSPEG